MHEFPELGKKPKNIRLHSSVLLLRSSSCDVATCELNFYGMCVCSGALQLKQSRWRLTVVVALKRKWVLNERDPSGVEGRQKSYSGNSVRPGDSVYWIWRPPWGKQARQASKSKQAAAQLQVDFHPPTSQDLADRYRERRTILKNTYRNSRAVCDTPAKRKDIPVQL